MIRKTSESHNLQTFLYYLKMPRPHHQLDDHRDYIEQALFNYESIKFIHQDLCQNFGYTGTTLTICRRIESWGFIMPVKQTCILIPRNYIIVFANSFFNMA